MNRRFTSTAKSPRKTYRKLKRVMSQMKKKYTTEHPRGFSCFSTTGGVVVSTVAEITGSPHFKVEEGQTKKEGREGRF